MVLIGVMTTGVCFEMPPWCAVLGLLFALAIAGDLLGGWKKALDGDTFHFLFMTDTIAQREGLCKLNMWVFMLSDSSTLPLLVGMDTTCGCCKLGLVRESCVGDGCW